MKARRALASFTVRHRRLRLRVRLLATITDVDAEFYVGYPRQKDHRVVFAYFAPAGVLAPHIGTITIPCDADLTEIIPHEVTRAVMYHIGGVHCSDDEALATAVGVLTSRIFCELARRGMEV